MDLTSRADALSEPFPVARPPLRATLLGLLRFTTAALATALVLTFLIMQLGLGTEVMARLLPPAPLRAGVFVAPHEVALPKSPFLEVARRKDGSLDPWLMEARYAAAGLSQAQALDIATHLTALSPVIVLVRDPVLEAQLRGEAAVAVATLQARYPQALAKLSIAPRRGDEFQTALWADFQAELLLQGFNPHPEDLPPPSAAKFQAALADLSTSASRAGLRALRIPTANYTTPATIKLLALRIDAANEALQQATGWPGGVLGLNGRIELLVGTPPGSKDQGYTQATRTLGRLRITGRHNTLAHEWLHALDFVLARQALAAPSHSTLSSQEGPLRIEKDRALATAWKTARRDLEAAAPHWMQARWKQSAKSLSPYWLSNSEEMAFAFQAHVARQSPMLALPQSLERYNIFFPYAYPTPAELDQQDPVWPKLFAQLPRQALTRAP